MYKIGILGTENSHAEAFTKIFNQPDEKGQLAYPDIRVVAVGGHVGEASDKLAQAFGVQRVDSAQAMLPLVDAVMVTARDGKYHADFALPFIQAGKPAFVDKPFTVCGDQALSLAQAAKAARVPLVGGSSLKYAADVLALKAAREGGVGEVHGGSVAAPLNMVNEYSGFYFYSSHLAEICLTIFGYDPQAVTAFEKDGNVTAVMHYPSFDVTCHYMDGCYSYFGAVYGKGDAQARMIDMDDCYRLECEAFAGMLRSGKMLHSYQELIAPVYVLNATYQSYLSGKTQAIQIPEV